MNNEGKHTTLDSIAKFYDQAFGNRDGKFDLKDLPNGAPAIVAAVVDLVMLIAEYRVWSAGNTLLHNGILALGFVAVSSIPFYLGQLAFLYNKANLAQKIISILMVLMGLGISGYIGFAEFLMGTVVNLGVASVNPVDPQTLYVIAVLGTVSLIMGGLGYGLVDDQIALNLKVARIKAKAEHSRREMQIKSELLKDYRSLRQSEIALQHEFPDDYEHVNSQFIPKRDRRQVAGSDATADRPTSVSPRLGNVDRPALTTPVHDVSASKPASKEDGKRSVFQPVVRPAPDFSPDESGDGYPIKPR